jgi:hypothetical protein
MTGLLADYNVGGHLERLVDVLLASEFAGEWVGLGLAVETFATLGIAEETDDRTVWQMCRTRGLVLVTANRNHDGPNSLEAAIRDGGPNDLPVVTFGDADPILTDSRYAETVAISLLGFLMDVADRPETVLGSGRIYVPKN